MSDAIVAIQQATSPDVFIDNALYTNDDATPVYRQRVEDPELLALVRQLVDSLSKLGTAFDASGRLYVNLANAAGTNATVAASQSGTWNVNATTVTNLGGFPANTSVFSFMQIAANSIRAQIVVT